MTDDDEEFDYHLEVANTGFGDMLHDWERNKKYYAALRKTIAHMHENGVEAHVLDIGTGTGILAMMAISAGADSVTACEAFLPMANCAEQIFAANGMAKKIHLIKKRSTDIVVGNGSEDLRQRANLLVTEVLDTELIGEGAINIYNHAHAALLTDDVFCIPAKARCYAQVAQSPLASQWNTMKTLFNTDGEVLLKPSEEVIRCKGEATLHDIQLSQLPLEQFVPITEAIQIFEFDFSSKQALELERCNIMRIATSRAGSTDLVFYWWDIDMDAAGKIQLSCAPVWAHTAFKAQNQKHQSLSSDGPLSKCIPWRDHWMQAIYYIPKPMHLTGIGDEFILFCQHDEYSLWFDACPTNCVPKTVPRHNCDCQLHMTYARSRIGQLNQSLRNKRYLSYLEETIKPQSSTVLTLGDSCILGLATSKMKALNVLSYEPHRFSREFMKSLALTNDLKNVQFIETLDELKTTDYSNLTHIFAEPYFMLSIMPWDNLYFGTLIAELQSKLPPNVEITPQAASLYAVPVEFLDLHKIRTPVGECEGFNLSLFDSMVNESAKKSLSKIEAQPLWEYPSRALAQKQKLLHISFLNFNEQQNNEGALEFECAGTCNGIAIWIDWHIDGTDNPRKVVSTGPVLSFSPGTYIKWDMFVRQGVQLFGHSKVIKPFESKLHWKCNFDAKTNKLDFDFNIND